jgi:type IV pilus assembly protein PilA
MSKRATDFSVIELLIVVAIILLIAAIAVPNLIHSRMAANESSAVASIRTVNTAQTSYSWSWSNGLAADLDFLGEPAGAAATSNNAEIIDPVLSANNASVESGYTFTLGPGVMPVTAPPGCAQLG